MTLIFYGGALRNGFVAMDNQQVIENAVLRNAANIPRLFSTNVRTYAPGMESNFYRPLQMLLYLAEFHVFSLKPLGWHAVNLLLHFGVVVAVYFLVRSLGGERLAVWTSLFFAMHPIHIEVVVWVAAVPELLSGLALVAGMYFHHRARTSEQPSRDVLLAALAFAVGLFGKETALVFPFLLLAYEFLSLRREGTRTPASLLRYLPMLGVLAIYLVLRVRALGAFAPAPGRETSVTPEEFLLSVPVLVLRYVGKLFAPVGLNYAYEFTPERTIRLAVIAGVALIVALIAGIYRLRRRQPLLAFAIAWFLLTLAPAMAIPYLGQNVFTERYLYIPSVGFCLAMGWVCKWMHEQTGKRLWRWVSVGATVALTAFWLFVTYLRVPDWHDDLALFRKTAMQSPNFAVIQARLGAIYLERKEYESAMERLERAANLDPDHIMTRIFLGQALSAMGRSTDAIRHYERAVELQPNNANTWADLGSVFARTKDWPRARNAYLQSLTLQPDRARTLVQFAIVLTSMGARREAIPYLRKAAELSPNSETPWVELGLNYAELQNWMEAATAFREAFRRNPDDARALTGLGNTLSKTGDPMGAEEAYRRAIHLQPGYLDANMNLAVLLYARGEKQQAMDTLAAALRQNPRADQAYLAHFNLGLMYERERNPTVAAREYEAAAALAPNFAPVQQRLAALRKGRPAPPR